MREMHPMFDGRLTALLDVEEIRQLRIRHARCLGGGDFEGFDQVFTADAVVAVADGEMSGLPAIKAGLAEAYRRYDRDARNHYAFVHAIIRSSTRLPITTSP
ncbi:nuclear transport factor 2 family protein [Sphingomonas sp. AP4-R1]|uniref:nuclear transport factor 2 family protein n=1 Tax=Sphingomonas sp. AP4-R1 TaxID=2735134 RepID=UPI001C0FC044|nr:nuclear transport factor 2 family protein [Sphingomonas sp. AP4-R1]